LRRAKQSTQSRMRRSRPCRSTLLYSSEARASTKRPTSTAPPKTRSTARRRRRLRAGASCGGPLGGGGRFTLGCLQSFVRDLAANAATERLLNEQAVMAGRDSFALPCRDVRRPCAGQVSASLPSAQSFDDLGHKHAANMTTRLSLRKPFFADKNVGVCRQLDWRMKGAMPEDKDPDLLAMAARLRLALEDSDDFKTVEALASHMGMLPSRLRNWFNGSARPGTTAARQLARTLHVDLEYIFEGKLDSLAHKKVIRLQGLEKRAGKPATEQADPGQAPRRGRPPKVKAALAGAASPPAPKSRRKAPANAS
jgi:transcriptional regulator with XRE-family HTH domain